MEPVVCPPQPLVPGSLYVVATPIGNLADITLRALAILSQVDKIAAEDTRHTKPLLNAYGITTPLIAYHTHNEAQATAKLLALLAAGKTVALVSDAGTPLVSDPGFDLITRAKAAGYPVWTVPGPCAAIAALSIAGLSTDQFWFVGFLPAKARARALQLDTMKAATVTQIVYEAPHRLKALLESVQDVLGDRPLVIARELTKRFETLYSGSAAVLLDAIDTGALPLKGECVVLIAGCAPTELQSKDTVTVALDDLLEHIKSISSVKTAAEIVSALTGLKKNALYKRAL